MQVVPLVLSGEDEAALGRQASSLHSLLTKHCESTVTQLGRTLAAHRVPAEYRAVVLAAGQQDALDGLRALALGKSSPLVVHGRAFTARRPVLVFPGAGCQWWGMGRELRRQSPVFAEHVARCASAVEVHLGSGLEAWLSDGPQPADWEEPIAYQPALFAMMVSLAGLWRSFGVHPGTVVGQCLGEIAAATAIGALPLSQGALISVASARAQAGVASHGDMAAVQLAPDDVRQRLERFNGSLVIAGVNGPESVVVSGDRVARDAFLSQCEADGVWASAIPTGAPTHSEHLEAARPQLLRDLAGLCPTDVSLPFYSSVTGGMVATRELIGGYWYRNVRQPMLFAEAVRSALHGDDVVLIEVSPHPSLAVPLHDIAESAGIQAAVIASVSRDRGGISAWLASVAQAFVNGVDVDWTAAFNDHALLADDAARVGGDRLAAGSPLDDQAMLPASDGTSAAGPTAPDAQIGVCTPLHLPKAQHFVRVEHDPPSRAGAREPLAIVGMACRLPGGVRSPEDLWRLVLAGGEGISDVPADRGWDLKALFGPDNSKSGTSCVRQGGFLEDAADFDPEFFGVSPREAAAIHPQQRLLMATAWEALERAGIVASRLRDTVTGVFVGAFATDYGPPMHVGGAGTDGYLLTGSTLSVASGRIAYHLGLLGPAITVDTACSSSLSALHLAAASLHSGECSLALVGASTVLGTPGLLVDFSRQGALAADGRSRAFSQDAAGFGIAEGTAVVVMTRPSQAQRLGCPVLALVRGSALSQDGASEGLTAPRGSSQELVIRRALTDAGLQVADVDLIEAHGTGTKVGDPVEAAAILATYGQHRPTDQPVYVGSVKSNIGHTLAAAGLAGLIKTVMALQHAVLPKTRYAERPLDTVDWFSGQLHLLRDARPWPHRTGPRRAGILSYGISGTNAHVILEQAPEPSSATVPGEHRALDSAEHPPSERLLPWLLSAHSAQALQAQAARLIAHIENRPDLGVADLGWSLATTRTHFDHRAALIAPDRGALIDALRALAEGRADPHLLQRTILSRTRTVFVFPGQGSQWAGMAAELLDTEPVFAERMRQCATALAPFTDWDLLDVARQTPGAPGLDRVDVVQPVLFAVMVSLAALWQAHGVTPQAVIGHSQGEIAAACVAGALSLADAAKVSALRSRALQQLTGCGGMATLALSVDQSAQRLKRWGNRLWIAAINGPNTTVVAGAAAALAEFLADCDSHGIWARRIEVDYASHGPHVEAIQEELLSGFEVQPQTAAIRFISTVTGAWVDTAGLNAAYWYRNLRETVRFDPAVRCLQDEGYTAFIEVSPHAVLGMGMHEVLEETPDQPAAVLATLHRGEGGLRRFHQALAEAHCHGILVDWERVFAPCDPGRVDLPTYAFQDRRLWVDHAAPQTDVCAAGLAPAQHPLLSAQVSLADSGSRLLTGSLSLESLPWLRDHAVRGSVLLPGTAFLECSLKAAEAVGCDRVDELVLEAPLLLPEEDSIRIQVVVAPDGFADRYTVDIYAQPAEASLDTPWIRHATAIVSTTPDVPARALQAEPLTVWPVKGAVPVALDNFYAELASAGYEYGPAFSNIRALWRTEDTVDAEVVLDPAFHKDAARFMVHPALLDAALHGLIIKADGPLNLPFVWQGVELHAVGATALRVRLRRTASDTVSMTVADPLGAPVTSVEALVLRPLTTDTLLTSAPAAYEGLLRTTWTQLPAASAAAAPAPRFAVLTPGGTSSGQQPGYATATAQYVTLSALRTAVAQGAPKPEMVVVDLGNDRRPFQPPHLHTIVQQCLALVQELLTDTAYAEVTMAFLTHGAVAARNDISDLAQAAVWGLIRTAQTEHPGRFLLVDSDGHEESLRNLTSALAVGEDQLALREGLLLRPQLAKAATTSALLQPASSGPWKLRRSAVGDLSLAPHTQTGTPLGPNDVRVAMRAAGMNFRDIVLTLDMVDTTDSWHGIGLEGSGIVTETGVGVTGFAPGDRVLGVFNTDTAFATTAVTDERLLTAMPAVATFTRAASIPVAFITAYRALVDLAGVRPGQKILIHAATGSTGLAAVHLAQHLGAEVYATTSSSKWHALHALGIDDDHITTSRTVDFEQRFLRLTGETGMDVVLNSLSGEFVDASLRLLPRGGRFLEMGKTDVRDSRAVAARYPGVAYRAFDITDVGVDRIHQILQTVVDLVTKGELKELPVTAWDIRRAPEAFAHFVKAQHIGKNVLVIPPSLNPDGTVLITGGTGTLGSLLARHLVRCHGVRHLLLASRSGARAAQAKALLRELTELGATVSLAACDSSDRGALEDLLAKVAPAHPLTGIIHTAAVLDDATVESLTAQQVSRVLQAKSDAAWHLHDLTKHMDLALFVLYSSATGHLGTGGQANYAAANTFLDALAHHRRAHNLPASSIAWGLWQQASGMTGHLRQADITRIRGWGLRPITDDDGLALLDAAIRIDEPVLLASHLDTAGLQARDPAEIPLLLRAMVPRSAPRRAHAGSPSVANSTTPVHNWPALPPEERQQQLLSLIRTHAATVLGHPDPLHIATDRSLREAGIDSLTSVQLRNRLNHVTGLTLPTTVVFSHPTPTALARYISDQLATATGSALDSSTHTDLHTTFCQAIERGQHDKAFARLRMAADRRLQGAGMATALAIDTTSLTPGISGPRIVCLPSLLAPAQPEQYTALAGYLDHRRHVVAVSLPGYRAGSSLAGSIDELASPLADAVLSAAASQPYVLLGHSSGGWIAHLLAHRMASDAGSCTPAGTVLLDTGMPNQARLPDIGEIARIVWDNPDIAPLLHDDALSAMGHYFGLFSSWRPEPHTAPTLLIRPTDDILGEELRWTCFDVTTTVRGNHLTMVTKHADETAQRIDSWLDSIPALTQDVCRPTTMEA